MSHTSWKNGIPENENNTRALRPVPGSAGPAGSKVPRRSSPCRARASATQRVDLFFAPIEDHCVPFLGREEPDVAEHPLDQRFQRWRNGARYPAFRIPHEQQSRLAGKLGGRRLVQDGGASDLFPLGSEKQMVRFLCASSGLSAAVPLSRVPLPSQSKIHASLPAVVHWRFLRLLAFAHRSSTIAESAPVTGFGSPCGLTYLLRRLSLHLAHAFERRDALAGDGLELGAELDLVVGDQLGPVASAADFDIEALFVV